VMMPVSTVTVKGDSEVSHRLRAPAPMASSTALRCQTKLWLVQVWLWLGVLGADGFVHGAALPNQTMARPSLALAWGFEFKPHAAFTADGLSHCMQS